MSSILSTTTRGLVSDRFEPESTLDPVDVRKLRGHLEQIDYAAFAANCEVVAHTLKSVDLASFQRMAVSAAHARAKWVEAAMKMTDNSNGLTVEQIAQLGALRHAYDELTAAYEAMHRMVERGYLAYRGKPSA